MLLGGEEQLKSVLVHCEMSGCLCVACKVVVKGVSQFLFLEVLGTLCVSSEGS